MLVVFGIFGFDFHCFLNNQVVRNIKHLTMIKPPSSRFSQSLKHPILVIIEATFAQPTKYTNIVTVGLVDVEVY